MATQSGEEFGQYLLERLIGHGAMGEVWEATDRIARRTVAIKRLAPHLAEKPEVRRRFEREARLAARLRDPHIVPIHRYGEIDGRLYVDMQLVAGMNLQEIIARQGPMQPERAVAIVAQVAHALTTAHKAGLVHRDVKPSNILVSVGHDGQDLAYLADFGITRNLQASPESQSSGALVVGTFDYMAPEQFDADASASSDIYSLGCVLFQCLTGSVPYPSGGLPAVMHAHLSSEPPRVSQRAPWVGTALDGVVARALSKDPRTRHETAMAFSSACRAALGAQDFRRTTRPASSSSILRRLTRPARGGTRPDTGSGTHPVRNFGPSGGGRAPTPTPAAAVPPQPPPPPARAPRSAGSARPARSAFPAPSDPASPWHNVPVGVTSRRRTVLAGAAIATAVVLLAAVAVAGISLTRESSADPTVPASVAPNAAPGPSLAQPVTLGIANLPGRPETVAVSADGAQTYSTTSTGPPALRIVDTASRAELTSIPIPGIPRFVGTAPGGMVYVSFNDDARDQLVVAAINPVVGAITKLISTGQPADRKSGQTWLFVFAMSPDGQRLYVPHHTRSVVSVLNTATGAAIAQIAMPNHPHSVALSPDGRTGYVAAHASGEVEVLDTTTNTVTATIPIGAGTSPHDLDVSPDGRLLHVVNYDAGTLTYIDTATRQVRGTLPVGRNPQSVAFSTDGRRSYVVDNATNTVAVIDTATHQVVGTVSVSVGASMIAVAPDGRRAYVASRNTGVITTMQTAD